MTTETCRLYQDHQRKMEAMFAELCDVATREFKPNMRVRWIHTYHRQPGVVEAQPVYREGMVKSVDKSCNVYIELKPGGPQHHQKAYLLDILEAPTK